MKTAEDIIISKKFYELSQSEKEIVQELVSGEDEYEAMRWFLTTTTQSFENEKIVPSSNLKQGVMAHLNQKQAAPKVFWLNGAGAFLFPADKKFYQYPGLQIAAVALLMVSAVAIFNYSKPVQNNLALHSDETIISQQENLMDSPNSDKDQMGITQPDNTSPEDQNDNETNEVSVGENRMTTQLNNDQVRELPADDVISTTSISTRDMAVAEEMKLSEAEQSYNYYSAPATSKEDNDAFVQEQMVLKDEQPLKKTESKVFTGNSKDASKNQKPGTKQENSKQTESTGFASDDAIGTSSPTTSVERNEGVTGGYLTGSAGGTYGETAADSSVNKTSTETEKSAKKVSVQQTAFLKKLMFIVK